MIRSPASVARTGMGRAVGKGMEMGRATGGGMAREMGRATGGVTGMGMETGKHALAWTRDC
jgi:hypothetical protein